MIQDMKHIATNSDPCLDLRERPFKNWIGYLVVGIGLLVVTSVFDIIRPYDRSWSILYLLVSLYAGRFLRGRPELFLHGSVLVSVFFVPLIFRPDAFGSGTGLFYRLIGTTAGFVVIGVIWNARLYSAALRQANEKLENANRTLEARVVSRTSELYTINQSLQSEINERKLSEESFRESEQRFTLFMQHLPGLAWIKDSQGRYLYVNSAAAHVFGISSDRLMGKKDEEIFPQETARQFRENDEKAMQSPNGILAVETLKHDDGETHHSIVSKFSLPGRDSHEFLTGGIAIDITERHRAAETIQNINRFLEALIKTAAEGICVCHSISEFPFIKFSVWNERMTEITGYTIEEINRLGWYQSLYQDLEVRELAQKRMASMREGYDIQGEEWEITRKDGQRRTVAISTSLVDTELGTQGVVALIQDITIRKRDEEQLLMMRFCVDHSGDALFWVNPQGRILYVNDVACSERGYTREELLKMTIFDLDVEPDYQPGLWEKHFENLRRDGVIMLETRHRTKDGRTFPVEVNANYVRIGDTEFNFAQTRNITDRKRLENQVLHSQKMEAIGRLAGGVAHDFNNLLTVIQGYGQLMIADLPAGSSHRESMVAILDAGDRAAQLTQQLLAFSRKAIVQPQIVDLNETIKNTLIMLRRLLEEDISLDVTYEPTLPRILASPGQLEQILMNLVLNARDSMPDGGKISLETRTIQNAIEEREGYPEQKTENSAQLIIIDNGHGMTDDVKNRIFEPFFTTKGVGKGTGLGLSVVHGVVTQLGGQIEVTSSLNVGTTFRIIFPGTSHDLNNAHSEIKSQVSRGHETIMLVEDEPAVRKIVRISLESFGYEILEASCGAEAMTIAKAFSGKIDLLLSDVVMPEMSGVSLFDELRRLIPGIRAVFMSGYTDDTLLRAGIQQGSETLLQKPFSSESLQRTIREKLNQVL